MDSTRGGKRPRRPNFSLSSKVNAVPGTPLSINEEGEGGRGRERGGGEEKRQRVSTLVEGAVLE